METKKPLMQMLIEAGYPRDQMFHHYSDLYIFAIPLTDKVIDEWCNENGYYRSLFCSKFKDNVTGMPMYDVAFQYLKLKEE